MSLEIHYNVYGCFRPPQSDIELAQAAVDAGFKGVWIGDHFMPWIDSRPYAHHVLPWLGSLMATVPEVPVGLSVTCPTIRYHPATLAQAFATLDNMYPGRLELGVGVGEALNDAHFVDGEWPDWGTRAGMLIEAIDAMDTLWNADEYVSFEGEYYRYDDVKLSTPPRDDIDFHWAGWGPQSCRCAGKYAGNLLTIAPPDRLENDILPAFREGLDAAERDRSGAEVTTEFMANVGEPAELVAEIRDRGEFVPDDTELDNPDPRDIQDVADDRLAAMSDGEIRDAYTITEEPSVIVEELERLESAGVTRVLVGSNCGDPRETIDAFERDVLPHFH